MSENLDKDVLSLFKKIKGELFILGITHEIEYHYYKESIYFPEIVKSEYEEAFFHFPHDEISTFDKIQIFHEFYTTDVWGPKEPMEIGDEKYFFSLQEIENNIKEPRSTYIFKKLKEKYANIESNIPSALIGYKKSEKLSDDHPEKNVLINLLNKYRKVLAHDDLQLGIFNNLYLNKIISDIFTEMLINLILDRLKLLEPEIKKYSGRPKPKVKFEESEEQEIIPLIRVSCPSQVKMSVFS